MSLSDQKNILFVCSRNLQRSPTAERIWQDDPRMNVRSRGISQKSARILGKADLQWADCVFVMENRHRSWIWQHLGRDLAGIYVLDIPDEFQFMDEELIDLLTNGVETILGSLD